MDFNRKPLVPVDFMLRIKLVKMYRYRYKNFSKKCLTTVPGVDILCEHSRDAEHQF